MSFNKEVLIIGSDKTLIREFAKLLDISGFSYRTPVTDFKEAGYFHDSFYLTAVLFGDIGNDNSDDELQKDIMRINYLRNMKYNGLIFFVTRVCNGLQHSKKIINPSKVEFFQPEFNLGKISNFSKLIDQIKIKVEAK